jgi:hypothetical protein
MPSTTTIVTREAVNAAPPTKMTARAPRSQSPSLCAHSWSATQRPMRGSRPTNDETRAGRCTRAPRLRQPCHGLPCPEGLGERVPAGRVGSGRRARTRCPLRRSRARRPATAAGVGRRWSPRTLGREIESPANASPVVDRMALPMATTPRSERPSLRANPLVRMRARSARSRGMSGRSPGRSAYRSGP